MIEEYVREMTAEERASLQSALRPPPAIARRSRSISTEAWGLAGVWVLTLVVIALAGGRNIGGFVFAAAVGGIVVGYHLVSAARRNARRREYGERYMEQRHPELARVLEDGRVTVKRVRAVAVVEIEPIEDEGTGYVFDLGDGRVLFLKGQDYFPADDGAPWPNTEFGSARPRTARCWTFTATERRFPRCASFPLRTSIPRKGGTSARKCWR